jgi:hypothetical protein
MTDATMITSAPRARLDVSAPKTPARGLPAGNALVLAVVACILLIRFFSEVVDVLPTAVAFVDVPLFIWLMVAAASQPWMQTDRRYALQLAAPSLLFVFISTIAVLTHLAWVAPAPAITFLYDFLSPLGVYWAAYRLWVPGYPRALSRMIIGLGLTELAVVAAFDLPRFVRTGNPDYVSGTFGENAYQLVFFLIVFAALLAGVRVFERARTSARFAPFLIAAAAATIFMAQYRALLVTTLAAMLLVGALLATVRGRGIIFGVVLVCVFFVSLSFVARHFPTTKLQSTIDAIQAKPGYFATSRFRTLTGVMGSLYEDHPLSALTGTGPGTFSSRAWRTFAQIENDPRTAAATAVIHRVNGGPYSPPPANEYIVPRIRALTYVEGSKALAWPLSSYTSLLAEVGLAGCLLLIGTYVAAAVRASRLAITAMRQRLPDDPLPGILLASAVAFFVLLQLAALDNWLEVTRITFFGWALLAVGTRELEFRDHESAEL